MLKLFRHGKGNTQGQTPTGQAPKIDFTHLAAVGYATFMTIYFGNALDSPIWDCLFFLCTNILILALSFRLRRYEKRRACLVIIALQLLSIVYNILYYIFEFTCLSQIAGLFFVIGLLLLIFLRKK